MISIDDFYINYKLIIERIIKSLISKSLDESKAYSDSLLIGLYSDRGLWDASSGTFPTTGGSGPAGAVKSGDVWTIQVAGIAGGYNLTVGDTIRAFIDSPGQTGANWVHVETGYGYVPFDKAGDDLTSTDGTGRIGLPAQTVNPATPATGVSLFANAAGDFNLIDSSGNVLNIEETLDILARNIQEIEIVDMVGDDLTLTAVQSQKNVIVILNPGDGSKTLSLFDSVLNPAIYTFYVLAPNGVTLRACTSNISSTLEPRVPEQFIYRPDFLQKLNYVPYQEPLSLTPGWATKVHFNKYGLIDNTSTISTADVPDSLNKRYVTEAEKAAIDNFIIAGGDYVPTSRTVNGHALTSNVTVTKGDVGLGNADNTSDANKPISTAVSTALGLKENVANKGVANGYVPLDSQTKIQLTYLPEAVLGALKFKGFWNAATNRIISSDLTINNQPIPPSSPTNEGWYFIVQTEGGSVIDGNYDWQQGDWVVSIGTSWEELDSTDAVWSVNGHEGIITLQTGDIPDEPNFRYVTDAEKTKLANLSGVNTGDKTLAELGGVPTSRTINGHALTVDINVTPLDIGLGNVNNTADLDKPVSTYQATAINAKQSTSQKGQANGYAPLDANSLVPSANLPHDTTKQDVSEKGQVNGYAPLNNLGKVPAIYLPAGLGGGGTAGAVKWMGNWDADLNIINSPDIAYDGLPIPPADSSNEGYYFVVAFPGDTNVDGEDFWVEEDWIVSTGLNWIRVNNESGVTSVNGRTGTNGAVTLVKADIGLGNVNNTSDLNKPISTATQTTLNLKEDKANKGVANGYVPLDSATKINPAYLPPALSTLKQIYYVITSTDVTNKNLTLPSTPAIPAEVDIVIYGGIHQRSTIDFLVTGNIVSWDSLALELLVEAGQTFLITYST